MNEPQGPQSPTVYRRRRYLAVTGLGVGALLFVWAVGALLGGGSTSSARGAADPSPHGVLTTSSATSATSSNPPSSGTVTPTTASSSAAPSTKPTVPTTTPATTTPPAPPRPCPDTAIRVSVTSGQASYPVGAHPDLVLHIANVGPVPCLRDVSHQLRSIEVLGPGGKAVWASNDCYALNTHEIVVLQPKQSLGYGVTWAGRTAAPGCPATRTTVPAGRYELVGRLGALTGPPTVLTLT